MNNMFEDCKSLTRLDLRGFNTENVTVMNAMFYKCGSLTTLDLSGWKNDKVTEMGGMFADCASLSSLDLSDFNTSNVTNMRSMFLNCGLLKSLDLSSFNTENVQFMLEMFSGCNHLKTIYAGSEWRTDAVNESSKMFYGCTNLVGGQGTTYDENHVDATFAHIDGGTSNPGYFTGKNAALRGDVDGDGGVNISDVTALIDYLMSGNATGINLDAANCNQDGAVNIADVTTLINFLLTDQW